MTITITSLKRFGILMPLILVAIGWMLLLINPLSLQILQNNLFDQYQRWYPRDYTDVPVRIIDIDEESLKRIGQWPWPRTRIAELVEILHAANASAIGFDMVFAEPDRTSPQAMSKLWPLNDPLRHALESLPDHDKVLADSLNFSGVILGFMAQRSSTDSGGIDIQSKLTAPVREPARPFRYINSGESPDHWLHSFNSAITALPELERVADGNGALSFVPDSDGVVRRVPLVLQVAGKPVPSLVSEGLRVAQGERNYVLKTEGKDIGLAEIQIGRFNIPTTAQGEIWIHYSRTVPNRYLSAWKIFAGEIPDALLDGNIVLLGSSAQGLMDLRFTPLGGIMPGVEIHAQAIEQILSGHNLYQPDWALAAESIIMIIGGLVIGFLAIRTKALFAAITTFMCLAALLWGGWCAFRYYGLLFNTATPALVVALTFVLGSLLHHFISEREQRWVKEMFSKYVSPNRVNYLIDHPDSVILGGARQDCSFVFTDLAGFTKLMENTDPGQAVAFLNSYIDQMVAIAFRHEGTLDRIVGDAVAIMFSAPVQQTDHHARALACAVEMDVFATSYAEKLNAEGIAFGKTRLGIHSGEVIVGNFGGSAVFDYRALGDPVNTAARLETVNKFLGTTICVSEVTLNGCTDANVRPVGRLVLKGKDNVIQVFEPLAAHRLEKYAPLDEYKIAYDLMATKSGATAMDIFRELAVRYPDDPLVVLHSRRLSAGSLDDLIIDRRK